jgi:hypothetical protein
MDLGTSDAGDPYLAIFAHFINKYTSKFESWGLSCLHAPGSHTGVHIAAFFHAAIQSWYPLFAFCFCHISQDTVRAINPWVIVVDNAANLDNTFITALSALDRGEGIPHYNVVSLKCSCHTLNLVLKDVFDPPDPPRGSLGTVYTTLQNIKVRSFSYCLANSD